MYKYNFCKMKQKENRSTGRNGHGQNVIPTHYKPIYVYSKCYTCRWTHIYLT